MEFLAGLIFGFMGYILFYLYLDWAQIRSRGEYRRKARMYDKIAEKYVVIEGPRGDLIVHDPTNRRRSRQFPPPGPGAGSPTYDFVIEEEAI